MSLMILDEIEHKIMRILIAVGIVFLAIYSILRSIVIVPDKVENLFIKIDGSLIGVPLGLIVYHEIAVIINNRKQQKQSNAGT